MFETCRIHYNYIKTLTLSLLLLYVYIYIYIYIYTIWSSACPASVTYLVHTLCPASQSRTWCIHCVQPHSHVPGAHIVSSLTVTYLVHTLCPASHKKMGGAIVWLHDGHSRRLIISLSLLDAISVPTCITNSTYEYKHRRRK
jgi:hypothetical protein